MHSPFVRPKPRVAVVGAGAFGGWAALVLRERGYNVTLVDAYGPGTTPPLIQVAGAQIAHEGTWRSPVEGALFFHAAYVSPGWRLTRVGRIDNHVFYR